MKTRVWMLGAIAALMLVGGVSRATAAEPVGANGKPHGPYVVIIGVGELTMIVDLCDSHYDLRDIDGDVIGWLKGEWRKQAL